jgi:para-nitrobenzyl esterase
MKTRREPSPRKRSFGFLCGLLLVLAAFLTVSAGPAAATATDPTLVKTNKGYVQGFTNGNVREFLGIPYAAPPVGALRWMPPKAHARWRTPLDATKFGPHCPQNLSVFGQASDTEDCLYLNVFTPAVQAKRQRLPVMVWIHGGAFVVGESDDYDPTNLVEDGNVIVVTFNYRLGVLGFFADPALDAEPHPVANYGLMDQQFALKWVRKNIRRFGGNPHKVTIFGESAGGLSVLCHLASPKSKHLFRRAIVESGAYQVALPLPTLTKAEATGETFANDVGCTGTDPATVAACLRAVPVSQILGEPEEDATAELLPIVDGKLLTQPLATSFARGMFNRVPVINGTNRNEYNLFVALYYDANPDVGPLTTEEEYEAAVAALIGYPVDSAAVTSVVNEYSLTDTTDYPTPDEALGAVGTDAGFACGALYTDQLLSMFVPTYAYEFNDPDPPNLLGVTFPVGFPDGLGAVHASELIYLFDPLGGLSPGVGSIPPFTAGQQTLSSAMIAYWTGFATASKRQLPAVMWSPYTAASGDMESLLPPTPVPESGSDFSTEHNCDFWTAFARTYP